ncbi:MAG: FkbM family methyltransferase, partial [Chitinophagaceae bacterium]|nr:FkbM family methyltransferase [Chitinophagaceae bacterium]
MSVFILNDFFFSIKAASSVLDEYVNPEAVTIQLTSNTLDEVARKHAFNNVSLVKLDVQGYELEVLK